MKKNITNYFYLNNTKIFNIEKNRNIIDYLENFNIKIPHYCYHPKLSVSGNCRMCLVELKNSPKPLISCAMTITNGMEIYTDSPLVKKARENILEFLLLNHPLDCPVCDQGGECDLQDQSFIFGSYNKRFFNYKRGVLNKNLGPIVKTVMTRCIHCTRCVRFAIEIANVPDLGMFGRGYNSEIGTYINKALDSELSGNIIDICPVGALTNKPYSFVDRNWESSNFHSIDCTDSFGESVNILVKNTSTITKIYPSYSKSNSSNNWITNKARFSFDGMFSAERQLNLSISSLNIDKSTWKSVFLEILNILYFQIHFNKLKYLNTSFNIIIGEIIDLEFLNILLLLKQQIPFLKVCKLKECNTSYFLDQENNFLTSNITEKFLSRSTSCLLIGINTRLESPSLNMILKQRMLQGNFEIYAINSLLDLKLPYKCLGNNLEILKNICEGTHTICQKLKKNNFPLIIYNSSLLKHSIINTILNSLHKHIKSKFVPFSNLNLVNKSLSESSTNYIGNLNNLTVKDLKNSLGLYLINISKKEKFINKLVNIKLINSLIFNFKNKLLNNFLVNQTHIKNISDNQLEHFKININLPNTSFYENSGFFISTEGYLKKSIKIIPTKGLTKPNFKIFKFFFHFLNTEFNKITNLLNDRINFLLNLKFFTLNFAPLLNVKSTSKNIFELKIKTLMLNFSNNQMCFLTKKHLTKPYIWLDDYYIGGKDLYSVFSKVMVECSKLSRLKNSNFLNIN